MLPNFFMTFSKREKIVESSSIKSDEMNKQIKNRIWNLLDQHIDGYNSFEKRNGLIEIIWDNFFKEDLGDLDGVDSYQ